MIVYKYFLKLAYRLKSICDYFPSHLYGNGPFSSARKQRGHRVSKIQNIKS